MNTADYIVKKMEELGVNEFFGVPGDYNFSILDSINSNSNTRWIGCTNELNAGYAADGYARLRGYGALVTTYGVGELSAMNAVAGCYAENIPIVHIVGLPSSKNIEKSTLLHHNFQDVNYDRFCNAYKNITAATAFITRDNAKLEIDRVLKVLIKERKPVYIALPLDVAEAEISSRYVDLDWASDKDILNDVAQKIADKINDSQKPVILGDILVKRFDAKIEFKEFVSKSAIPVTNFMMGANLIDNDYELYLGGYYNNLDNPISKKYLDETDCLIAVGTIYSDINSFGFGLPYKINDHIAIYGNYTYIDGVRYDNIKMSDVLEKVTEIIEPKNIKTDKPDIGYKQKLSNGEILTSEYFYPRIQEYIKENDIIIAETGSVPQGICNMKFPNSANIQFQTLWGSIGWATPAALGASLAKPNARVILITGEGAHQATGMEIGNFLRQGIKPVVIVINNNGYTTERFLCKDENAEYNDIIQMNYAKFSRVFEGDIWATKVATSDDFDKALKVTQIMNKMCYIEVCLDKMDVPTLTNTIINSLNNHEAKTTVPEKTFYKEEIKDKEIDLQDYSPFSSDFEYETTVHQVFKKDFIENDSSYKEDEIVKQEYEALQKTEGNI